ncbi:hypothetical protein [Brevibacillus laterosporus]|uniref:hypothetical protein n=1 Tax=Brevibacillus laterosporus TaxID=1465 RepID=UPI00215D3CB6|nr:hypothetical protein [Brevibacillus laterosporus]MCR8994693.1 hypothetical protein [Brevibacillus laterosporus]
MGNKKILIIELESNEEIDIHEVMDNIDNAIFNGEDTGVQEWTVIEVEEDEEISDVIKQYSILVKPKH